MLRENHCGLAIMRLQPMHFGHVDLLTKMIDECNIPVLAIGSAQESRTYGNPFTFRERLSMVKGFPGMSRLNVIPLKDIFNLGAWARYALDTVEKKIKTKVSVYYCGADQDGALFLKEGMKLALVQRKTIYTGRTAHDFLSATKVRNWLLTGNNEWKSHVPSTSHKIIEKVYKGAKI